MDINLAVHRLAALAEPTRLRVFRRLVRAAPNGLCVSQLLEEVEISQPALSFHLKELSVAGLLQRQRDGRRIYYRPVTGAMTELMAYLTENCCEGGRCDLNAESMARTEELDRAC